MTEVIEGCEAHDEPGFKPNETVMAILDLVDASVKPDDEDIPTAISRLLSELPADELANFLMSLFRDKHTGLYTYNVMESALEQAIKVSQDQPSLFVHTDLSKFKGINDRHGHEAGDEVLRLWAEALANTTRRTNDGLRPTDKILPVNTTHRKGVYRKGGDEIGLLLDASKISHSEQKQHDTVQLVLSRAIGDKALNAFLDELKRDSFGVRAAYVLLKPMMTVSDVLSITDPSHRTMVGSVLTRKKGVLQVFDRVPQKRG